MGVFSDVFSDIAESSEPQSRVSIAADRMQEIVDKQKEHGNVTADEIEEFKSLADEVREVLNIK